LNKLENFNLKIIFLTSRPADHSDQTRLLLSEANEDNAHIPQAPLFTSHEDVIEALYHQLISTASGSYKSFLLRSLSDLYIAAGRNTSPFILGIGDRITDCLAYLGAGVLEDYVFLIDSHSKIKPWNSDIVFSSYKDSNFINYLDAAFMRPQNST
jgi:phosphatidate phosphatase PAH1